MLLLLLVVVNDVVAIVVNDVVAVVVVVDFSITAELIRILLSPWRSLLVESLAQLWFWHVF